MNHTVITQCPKCGCELDKPMPLSSACPACGIYFFKYMNSASGIFPVRNIEQALDESEHGFALLRPLERMDAASFYGRCAALVLLALWSWFLIAYDYRYAEINGSFMHSILLPIHEAGHVLFMPFGEFLMILGGSVFQLMVPLGISIAFYWKQRDNFGAAMGAWWAGVSLVDLSAYIYDSLHPQMIMVGGHTGETGPHDWIYLLGSFGQLPHAQGIGAFVHACGALFMIVALLWGAMVLWRQKQSGLVSSGLGLSHDQYD